MKQPQINKGLMKGIVMAALVCIIITVVYLFNNNAPAPDKPKSSAVAHALSHGVPTTTWEAPNESSIPAGKTGEDIRYGRELITHTAKYLGPRGSVAAISNGMNCQNCHLAGGTKLFANNYAVFTSSYPKMSNRSGRFEPPAKRVMDCFERSLAGKAPDTAGREVRAMLAYIAWVGKDVNKGRKIFGSATGKLAYINQAANPIKGKAVFTEKCKTCHGANGEGLLAADKKTYTYPPLWGSHSYNDGAGMYRLSNFAGFVKNNMPFGTTYQKPQLTDEEAWNVAAFVNSQPRPHINQQQDWPDLNKKPIDAPFGPYADGFSEKQHKFGPFKPIKDARAALTIKKS